MDDTLRIINKLANERHDLWKLAAHKSISAGQLNRIHYITNELQNLWDRHRRELASERYGDRATNSNFRKAA